MSDSGVVLMWCEDGHTWINQGDGTVSPSWGLGGAHMPVADPRVCPEPDRDEDGQTTCPSCGGRRYIGVCDQCSGADDRESAYPPPACLKPALGGNAWDDRDLPFDGHRWCAWWVRKRKGGPWRLTFHQGQESRLWAATYRCLDVHTAEWFEVDRTWDVRPASLGQYPAYLRERWWTTPGGAKLVGCWSTMARSGAGYLIDRRQVERWVREAVEEGAATAGLQLALDVDA